MKNKPAFIIGNGTTRNGFDLNKLKGNGVTFGCNALYRDFKPDYLIAIDHGIINEIKSSGWPNKKLIVPIEDEQYEPYEFNQYRPRENTGMVAMREAIRKGHTELICIGIDFIFEDYDTNMDNVYKNTLNYTNSTKTTYNDIKSRVSYFNYFTKIHPNVKFYFVYPPQLPRFQNIANNNIFKIRYQDFIDTLVTKEE